MYQIRIWVSLLITVSGIDYVYAEKEYTLLMIYPVRTYYISHL